MAVLGSAIGSSLLGSGGQIAGQKLGRKIGGKTGSKILGSVLGSVGRVAGSLGGALLPFEKGGRVPGAKGKPMPILAHSGEFVLPVGVPPTAKQIAMVAKGKKGKK